MSILSRRDCREAVHLRLLLAHQVKACWTPDNSAVGPAVALATRGASAVLALVAELSRACIGPLRLVWVDVDARSLRVAPAAGELLIADKVPLHRHAPRLPLRYVGVAVGTDALREEVCVLAGTRHAKGHRAVLRPPVLLTVD